MIWHMYHSIVLYMASNPRFVPSHMYHPMLKKQSQGGESEPYFGAVVKTCLASAKEKSTQSADQSNMPQRRPVLPYMSETETLFQTIVTGNTRLSMVQHNSQIGTPRQRQWGSSLSDVLKPRTIRHAFQKQSVWPSNTNLVHDKLSSSVPETHNQLCISMGSLTIELVN